MRKSYAPGLKAKVALEAAAGQRGLSDLASQYEVHPNLIRQWRKVLLAGAPGLFSDRRRREEEAAEQGQAKLYEEIGRLKVELDWLKKKGGQLGR
jgi:transposase